MERKANEEVLTPNETAGEWIGYQGAAEITGLCLNTLYALVHRRQIPHARLSPRMVRFSKTGLRDWLQSHAVPVTDSARKLPKVL